MVYDTSVIELKDTDPIAEQPPDINVVLKRHQLTLLHRCRQFESEQLPLNQFESLLGRSNVEEGDYMRTRVGILGDQVGSGKSYVMLSLVLTDNVPHVGPSLRSYGCNQVLVCKQDHVQSLKTSLLVIPHNLTAQWTTYIQNFSPNMKYTVLSRSRNVSWFINDDNIADYDLIVVTSTFYNRVAQYITSKTMKLRRVIFDEVDDINIPSCESVYSDFFWFVTASYGNLVWPRGYHKWDPISMRCIWHATGIKNSGFIKKLFIDLSANVDRDLIKILVVRNSPDYVQQSMTLPPMIVNNVICKTPITIGILRGIVGRQIIDALNGGDTATALSYVNPHNRTTEDCIITAMIQKYTNVVHNLNQKLQMIERLTYDNEADRENEMRNTTAQIQAFEHKINSIRNRIRESNTCMICFEEHMVNKCVVPCCSNSFCFGCISRWLATSSSATCPACKHIPLTLDSLMVVDNTDVTRRIVMPANDEISPLHSKVGNLEAILRQREHGARYLIFSEYDFSFEKIVPVLNKLGMKYNTIKGNHAVVNRVVERYQAGDINVLLVNASQYGSGINLECTSDVIMFHRMNSEIEKQVVGRAQRYNRVGSLRVWYLLHDQEITQMAPVASSSTASS